MRGIVQNTKNCLHFQHDTRSSHSSDFPYFEKTRLALSDSATVTKKEKKQQTNNNNSQKASGPSYFGAGNNAAHHTPTRLRMSDDRQQASVVCVFTENDDTSCHPFTFTLLSLFQDARLIMNTD